MSAIVIKRLLIGTALVISAAAGANADHRRTTREALVGSWRLLRIEVSGPRGVEPDPFYGAGCEGLLVYDPSGWFSVQIMGPHAPTFELPASRPENDDDTRLAQKARALDSYYAYYGTWSFDAATETVTHHAKGALYPAEKAANYSQHAEAHGATLTLTRTQGSADSRSVQTKVWERAAQP